MPNTPCIQEKYQSNLLQIEGVWFYAISRCSSSQGFTLRLSLYCATSQQVSQPLTLIAFHSLLMESTYKNKKMHHVVPTSCKVRLLVKMPTNLTAFTLCSYGYRINLNYLNFMVIAFRAEVRLNCLVLSNSVVPVLFRGLHNSLVLIG